VSGSDDVEAWFVANDHALTGAARLLRAAILRAAPHAAESIKWQAPNFALDDDFATFSMRRPGVLQVILHTGAVPKPELAPIAVDGLERHLRWPGHNRAVVTFRSHDEVIDALDEFESVVRAWVAQLP